MVICSIGGTMECSTKYIGDMSEEMVKIAFLKNGWYPSVPVGDNLRYDLVLDKDGALYKVQCKTAKFINGTVKFPVCSSSNHVNRGKRNYHGEVDYIAAYCPELNSVYLIPIKEVGISTCTLRIKDPARKDKSIRLAANYQIL
jgi:hypothetical protein